MAHISVNLPEELYQQLQIRAQELAPEMGELKISDSVRILLRYAIEKIDNNVSPKANDKVLQYLITTYYLVNEYIASLGEIGAQMNHNAHEKADKIVMNLLNQIQNQLPGNPIV